jgi:plastocyanin
MPGARAGEAQEAPLLPSWARLIAKVFQADPLVCKRCGGPLKVVAYITDTVAIRRVLDHHGLSPPEKPPPEVRGVVRMPVDDEGREIGANPAYTWHAISLDSRSSRGILFPFKGRQTDLEARIGPLRQMRGHTARSGMGEGHAESYPRSSGFPFAFAPLEKAVVYRSLSIRLRPGSETTVRLVDFEEGKMKRLLTSIRFPTALSCLLLVLAVLIAFPAVPVAAAQAQAIVGAESGDKGRQALAFLPNELWVHVGDSVTWAFPTTEIHTISFLRDGQTRPPFPVGCPGTTPNGSDETAAACVNSGVLAGGATYSVHFPTAGNFKFVCLVHANMTGVVHVLDPSQSVPHDQAFYDRQVRKERAELLSDGSRLESRGIATAKRTFGDDEGDNEGDNEQTSREEVTAGIGEIVATTGGGSHTVSVMRFLPGRMSVHVGDTVEWTNLEAVTNHTVTFGVEPSDPPTAPPSSGVRVDPDGARHAVIGSPTDNVHSGLLNPARQDRIGLPQTPLGVTRFRVTFTSPGTFNYICALHDDLGMKGTVLVVP